MKFCVSHVVLCLGLSLTLRAQQAPLQPPASAAAGVGQETLPIGPGDRVQVHVFDTPELDERVRVTDSGELPLVLGGSVQIGGMTPVTAARAIEQVLMREHFMLHPQVSVMVDDFQAGTASVVGQVKTPGAYPINTSRNVLSVLALAGGLNDSADHHLVIIRRDTGEKIPFFFTNDLSEMTGSGVLVHPGDVVVVARAPMFFVMGDVTRAGGYVNTTNHSQVTVLQALTLAGGTSPTAAVDHTILVRKDAQGQPIEIALRVGDMRKGKQVDMVLNPDDILYVPFSYLKNIAVGAGGLISAAASAGIYRF